MKSVKSVKSAKSDFIAPIAVLSLICLVISGALAITNSFTEPIITSAAELRETAARKEMIPQADAYERIPIDGLPATIREAVRTTNDVGYVFTVVTNGYGGEVKVICGVGHDGNIIHSRVLEHSETEGLGSMIGDYSFSDQFDGRSKDQIEDIDAITGATISTVAYVKAIRDALAAYEIVRETGL